MRRVFGVIRIVAAGVIIAAIVAQLVHSIALVPDVPHFLVNFFSYFTILSNALAALALLVGAYYSFTVRRDPAWYNLSLAAVVTYMATTGVVYNLLLRSISLDQGSTVPWSNEVLHLVAPIYVVVVWILTPGKSPLRWSAIGAIVAFPLVWSVYTMIRGPIVGWYPYPFLNPAQPGGYGAVAVYVVAIAGFIGLMAVVVVALSRTRILRG
ncbi:Pr6Pr family membrane protein [Herbiconiux sp. CPCC 203407]|uniref:Pr6Pr family membrane protein n=1 Tax=Herbiconiux oxytropis TaxID=2970915 RepID=A0AA41XEY0_9MICO|nr:Pr6Pr family membrane protein [Herbiconiux oxytropis]MCS5720988.1 Pr6Pr family membrane protein [Herbiconiux oxytropis]MCS5724465.1 Pr6Pr family membrane protein [Herbiconiux oxytropis]